MGWLIKKILKDKRARIATQVILAIALTVGFGLLLSYLYHQSIRAAETNSVVINNSTATTAIASQRKCVRASNGDLYAVYARSDGTAQQIYLSKSIDNGATWVEQGKVHADVAAEQKEPAIAVDSSDNLHVVWLGKGWGTNTANFNLQYRKKTATWQTQESVTDIANDQSGASVAIDSSNNVHTAWYGKGWGTNTTINNIEYSKRTSASTDWANNRESVTDKTADQLSPSLAIDSSNNVHTVWYGLGWDTNSGFNNIEYSKRVSASTDWANNRESVSTDKNNHQLSPAAAIDSSDNVHAAWYGKGWGTGGNTAFNNIQYRKRTDSWQTQESVTDVGYDQLSPSIALDSADYIYAVWAGKGWGTNTTNYNIQARKKTTTWQTQLAITDVAVEQTNPALLWHQYPAIFTNVKTNIITSGFSFIWTNTGTGIKFYASDGIIWPKVYFVVNPVNPTPSVGASTNITITASKKNASGSDVTVTGYTAASTVSVSANGAATFTSPSSGNPISLTNTNFTNGGATVTITDNTAQNVTTTATDQSNTSITGNTNVSFQAAVANKFILNQPADINAGAEASYLVTLADQYNNAVNAGSGGRVVYLFTNSTGANAKFRATSGGATITQLTIPQGSSTASFYYYDRKAGTRTITASDTTPANGATGLIDATDTLVVNLGAAGEEGEVKEKEAGIKERLEDLKKHYKIKFGKDEAEIGDFESTDFRPHVKLKRWGEECFFSIEFPDAHIPRKAKAVDKKNDKIEWDSPQLGSRFYKKEREEIKQEVSVKGRKEKSLHKFIKNDNGGLEFEIVLKGKPASNIISLPFKSRGLKFYYQGPLTQAEIDKGIIRPDEVVGSYAVYHESKKDKKYETGKAFHIYRPKIIDRNGNRVWGELNIDETKRVVTITIDQTWLNNAAYPVVIDPEFGYMAIGSSAISINNVVRGSIFRALEMTPTSITAYLENVNSSTPQKAKYAIYSADNLTLVGTTAEVTLPPLGKGWYKGHYSPQPNLLDKDYALVATGESNDILIYFDAGAPNQGVSEQRDYALAWPETTSFTHDNNIYSIYDAAGVIDHYRITSASAPELDYMEYATNVIAQTTYVSTGGTLPTGGTITTEGDYTVHTFTSSGTFQIIAGSGNIDVLVVAGGGGGGYAGGGGGAGGYIYQTSLSRGVGLYTVTIGGGGNGTGVNGSNSVFDTITAIGGGGGGAVNGSGLDGGSGGGGGASGGGNMPGGAGTSGQGYAGGSNDGFYAWPYPAGGGGGASEVGKTPTISSIAGGGGNGVSNSISGSAVYYAGGGGGATYGEDGTGGTGGLGGGGNGVSGGNGLPATPNTGGGGGGTDAYHSGGGGAGGSGIVIVRYLTTNFVSLGPYSESTIKEQGSYSLKAIASATNSLDKTLTRTVSPVIDLTAMTQINLKARASRTGTNFKIGFHDSGGTTTESSINILSANTWETKIVDISGVPNANKDAIDSVVITITDANAVNTIYLDDVYGSLTSITWQTVGTGWTETVTAKDDTNATVTSDSTTVFTMTNSGNAKFYPDANYDATPGTYTWTQTSDTDFNAGAKNQVAVSAGDVKLTATGASIAAKLADPTSLPGTQSGWGIAFSSDNKFLAVSTPDRPHLTVYNFDPVAGSIGAKSTDLTDNLTAYPDPIGNGYGIAFSSDNKFLAIAQANSPYFSVYNFNPVPPGILGTKLADPTTLPTGTGRNVAFSSDNKFLAVAHTGSPYLTVYNFDPVTGTIGTKLADPTTLPAGNGQEVAFFSDNKFLAVGLDASPYLTVYNFDPGPPGSIGTKLADPATLPGNVGLGIALSSDNKFLALTIWGNIKPWVYNFNPGPPGSFGTKLDDPTAGCPSYVIDVAFSSDNKLLAVAHWGSTGSPYYLTVYNFDPGPPGTFGTGTTLDNPTPPTGQGNGVAFSSDSKFLAVAHDTSPCLTVYKMGFLSSSGDLISSSSGNLGAKTSIGSLSWSATTPANTTLKFQIATNTDNTTWNFIGPDGTASTYYTASGQKIYYSVPYNYVKYKAYFSTTDTSVTPTLSDVTITDAPEINSYTLTAGQATIYVKDAVVETITLTATDANAKTGTSTNILVNPAAIDHYSVPGPTPQVAGTGWSEAITAYDVYNNIVTTDSTTLITLTNTGNALFYTNDSYAAPTTTYTLASGIATIYVKDTTPQIITLTARDANTKTGTSGNIYVKHGAPDHLRFQASITSPQKVGEGFILPVLEAVDAYGNVLNSNYGATAYGGIGKTISYALSGQVNAPDGNGTDSWTTAVDFTDGVSTTTLNTTLYRAQNTTITPSASDVTAGTNTASNSITVNPETATKLRFKQQPSGTGTVNVALTQQPIVAIRDTYGNQTANTYSITLYDSSNNSYPYSGAPGTLAATTNPLAATAGQAEFSGVTYDKPGNIYLYAECASPFIYGFSTGISFSVASTSTVEAAAPGDEIGNFYLIPTKDDFTNKFEVLKFKVKDAGQDLTPTLIDQIKVKIVGTDASADIAWAGLYVGGTQVTTATGAAITDDDITFGVNPDAGNDADLYLVPDGPNNAVEFTVWIYMKDGKMTATDGQTYTFDIDETGIGTDTAVSSKMTADSGKITPVIGTIQVNVSHLELVKAQGGSATLSTTPGTPEELSVRATDANKNIDINYTGNKTLIFSGLGTVGSYMPKIEEGTAAETIFGSPITISFSNGVSATEAVTLTAYKAEGPVPVSVAESGQSYSAHTLSVTVSNAAAAASSMTKAEVSGDNQKGAATKPLVNPFVVVAKDMYGNGVPDVGVTFAISSTPGGGSLSTPTTTTTNAQGLAQTTLTLGVAGDYQVTATSSFPTLTFYATALTPTALTKVSGEPQSNAVTLALGSPFVVKLRDASDVGVPGEPVTFAIIAYPDGAYPSGTTGKLSVTSAVTSAVINISGQASTVLTLGNKIGEYKVRATSGSFTADFTATALPGAAYKVVFLTGPGSINAGDVSQTAFTITLMDSYDNVAKSSGVATQFSLSTTATATGTFYSDNAGSPGSIIADNKITIGVDTSSASFHYKDTSTGAPTIKVTRTSGEPLTVAFAEWQVTIIPGGLGRFVVSGSIADMTTGDSRFPITITAYDTQRNLKINLTQMNVYFSGANVSPATPSSSPTCSNSSSADINFGSATLLNFTDGVATTTLKVYKAETVHIKAMDAATNPTVTTLDTEDLDILVKHNIPNHLKFSGNIPEPGGGFKVGVQFALGTLNAVDLYDNVCNGLNGGTVYTGTNKTVNYTLSGIANAPDALLVPPANDLYTTTVDFTAGASATTLNTTLYRSQTTTITARANDLLTGTNVASNPIIVKPEAVAKLSFYQQPAPQPPATFTLTNTALYQQPQVAVADQYGNPCTTAPEQVQITLTASLTTGTYTAVPSGHILSGDSLQMVTSGGLAIFNDIKYSYPEQIYLRASTTSKEVYSFQLDFRTASNDGTLTASDVLVEPATISSTAYSDETKVQVFDFKITDAGTDGFGIKIKQIRIKRGSSDNTGDWLSYIAGTTLSNGTTSMTGTITDSALTFGTGTSIILNDPADPTNSPTVANKGYKTFTLSLYLKQILPTDANGKTIAFSIDPNDDIIVDAIGSAFAAGEPLTSSSNVYVAATKFIVTGSANTVAAGSSSPPTLTLKAVDVNGNIDTNYAGPKEIIFSGANIATTGNKPTCTNYSGVPVNFGDITMISFVAGQNSSVPDKAIIMRLYKAEGAVIKARTSDSLITTPDTADLEIVVTGGTAAKLSWVTQPESTVVANAPWRPFSVGVTDAYGNIASSAVSVIVTPFGGDQSAGSTGLVQAESGIATFNNFRVYCATYPGAVTVNANDAAYTVTPSGASNMVTVMGKYAITLKVLDSVNGSALTEVTLKILNATAPNAGELTTGLTNPITGNSPFSYYLPYRAYQFNLNKDAYVETTIEKTPDPSSDVVDGLYDNNVTWSVFIMSIAESMADYRVLSDFVYAEDIDTITATVRLEKRGKQIVTDNVNTLRACNLDIYDSSDAVTPKYSTSLAAADANGNYWFNIDKATTSRGFVSGKSYFVRMTILYGGEVLIRNILYSAVNTFDIGVAARLKTWTSEIKGEVSGVKKTVADEAFITRSQVTSEAKTTRGTVETEAAGVKDRVDEKTGEIKTETAKILTAAETTLPGQITTAKEETVTSIKTDIQPHVKSGILNQETVVRTGSTVTISYRTDSGLSPVIDVYDPNNNLKVSKGVMKEVGTSGVYKYDVAFSSAWGRGEFNIVCSESTKGTADAFVMTVQSTDIEQMSGQVSAVLGGTTGITKLKEVAANLNNQFSGIDKVLANLSKSISSKVAETKGMLSDLESVYNQLNDISKQISQIGGTEGINLKKLYDVSKEKKEDMVYLKNKTEELKAVMDLNQKMMENVAKKPIVQTWFEFK